jgi:hypothetical protein
MCIIKGTNIEYYKNIIIINLNNLFKFISNFKNIFDFIKYFINIFKLSIQYE